MTWAVLILPLKLPKKWPENCNFFTKILLQKKIVNSDWLFYTWNLALGVSLLHLKTKNLSLFFLGRDNSHKIKEPPNRVRQADKKNRINKMALKEFVSNFKRSGTIRFFTV